MSSTTQLQKLEKDATPFGTMVRPDQYVPSLQPVLTGVSISVDSPGDVFKVGGEFIKNDWVDYFALTKSSLELFARALGIRWDTDKSCAVKLERDYVLFEAIGYYRNPDGTEMPIKGTKEVDILVLEEEAKLTQLRKVGLDKVCERKGIDFKALRDNKKRQALRTEAGQFLLHDLTPREKEVLAHRVASEMILLKLHKVARAETGARNRAVRSLGIKSQWTAGELAQPFPCVKWQFSATSEQVAARSFLLYGDESNRARASMPGEFGRREKSESRAIEEGHNAAGRPGAATGGHNGAKEEYPGQGGGEEAAGDATEDEAVRFALIGLMANHSPPVSGGIELAAKIALASGADLAALEAEVQALIKPKGKGRKAKPKPKANKEPAQGEPPPQEEPPPQGDMTAVDAACARLGDALEEPGLGAGYVSEIKAHLASILESDWPAEKDQLTTIKGLERRVHKATEALRAQA